jgi:hypothetical protein
MSLNRSMKCITEIRERMSRQSDGDRDRNKLGKDSEIVFVSQKLRLFKQ